jgi:hypothetical protein
MGNATHAIWSLQAQPTRWHVQYTYLLFLLLFSFSKLPNHLSIQVITKKKIKKTNKALSLVFLTFKNNLVILLFFKK